MNSTHVTKVLPYAPDDLLALVGDVDRYPEFVPWVTALKTWNRTTPSPGVSTVDAEAKVGFAFVQERFGTRVKQDAGARTIEVSLLYGPFKRLSNRWAFHSDPAGTRVEFDIDFAFKSRLLDALLHANSKAAADRIMACFEARARQLYGATGAAAAATGGA